MLSKNTLLSLLLLSPLKAFASGGDVIPTILLELGVILSLLTFIGVINWKFTGKLLLFATLLFSIFLTFATVGRIPFSENKTLINTFSVVIPLVCVLGVFLIMHKRFSKGNPE